ncbi:MAG TPA: hypothetical protein VGI00_06585 [Streptosporangiaceae bacterium]
MSIMFDAVDIDQIPGDASVVAGYINGNFVTFGQLSGMFPNARHLSIAVTAEANADALDVEPGDATAGQMPAWFRRQKARGVARPVIYASVSCMTTGILPVLKQAGIARSDVRLWSAHYTDAEHLCGPGSCGEMPVQADATQWTKHALGRNLDQSVLAGNFFGAPPMPTAVFTSVGQASLANLATNTLHNGVATILQLTAERSPGATFTERMATYLDDVFTADKEKVPGGITVYHPDGNDAAPFNSHGDQTLLGLSLAFKCQPSTIVQLTAEKSPGAMFSGVMAQYLNDVFTRSATKVPEGIHLFYEK